jgi:hypothetical protein
MKFKVLMAMKMLVVALWVVTPRGLVGGYQCFGRMYHLHLWGEGGGDTFLHKGINHLQDNTSSQPRRPQSSW